MHVVKGFITLLLSLSLASLALLAHAQCPEETLRIAVIPKARQSLDGSMLDYQPLARHLSTALNMPVEIVPAPSYESVIDAVVSGGVDMAWLGPAAYVIAHRRDPRIEPFASLTLSPGHFTPAGHYYQSLLVTLGNGAPNIAALKGQRVVLSDPASTSGAVIPATEFAAQVGQPLPAFFGLVAYSGSHDKSLDTLLEHRADAAFVASTRLDAYLKDGHIGQNTLKVLWRSGPIYNDPFVFSGGLCNALKTQVREAMLNAAEPLADFLQAQGASAIGPISAADYAPLVRIMANTE